MEFFNVVAEFLYSWLLDATNDDYKYFQCGPNFGSGMLWFLLALLIVPLVGCAFFYFYQARKLSTGTKENYLWTFLLSGLTMIVIDYLLMAFLADMDNPQPFESWNFWKSVTISLAYFILVYQIYSWFLKGMSRVPNVDLWNICFGK